MRSSTEGAPGPRVVGVSVPLGHIEPEAFLAWAPPGARGFWQRGRRWVAHAGVAGEVRAPPYGAASDRFEAVRRGAELLFGVGHEDGAWRIQELDGPPVSGAVGAPRNAPTPRLFGAFTYDEEPRASARFVLPALELEGGSGGCTLRAWERLEPGADPVGPERDLRERLRQAVRSVREARAPATATMQPSAWFASPDDSAWRASVARLLGRIATGELEKAVLARRLELHFREALDPLCALDRLRRQNPRAWPFFFELGPAGALFGAAPELLVRLRAGRLRTMAVAGTAGPEGGLEESEKDLREHAIAVAELRDRLAGWSEPLRIDPEPRLLRLAGVQHLRTDLRGRVPPGTHVLSALRRLHPTAAVCGRPRGVARRVLAAEEPAGRGWYAGPVGWFDANGDGLFVPALRSATLEGARIRLYAGAGIVSGSRGADEWRETGLKFETALEALGVDGARLGATA